MKVKIALDRKASECEGDQFIQLRTPLTGYARKEGVPWVMDNGAFSNFDESKFMRMAQVALADKQCLWLAMPDVVGNHPKTLHQFHSYKERLSRYFIPIPDFSLKAAFVIQDGCNQHSVPWTDITAVFLGGSDSFKASREAWVILEEAKRRGKWVHVGRVNTPPRIVYFHGLADSIDGSGIARFDHMLKRAIETIKHLDATTQTELWTV